MAANKKKATARHTEDTPVKSFLDMIAPSVVQFNPDHFICGNTFRCVWALREYPTQTDEQALLRHLGEKDGITLRIYTRQLTPAEEKRIIQNAANKNRMGSSNTNDLQQTITAESNLQDMISMEGSRHRNKEPLFHCAVYIELTASDHNALKLLQTDVLTELVRSKLNVDRLLLRQQQGFCCASPVGYNAFGAQFERVLPASSVANLYPFNYSGKTDAKGFYVGRDKYGSNILVDFDQRDEDKTSANILILGNSGQGKSYLMKLLILNLLESGKSIITLDAEHEQQEMCEAVGGCFADLMAGKYIINVLEPKCWDDGGDPDDTAAPEAFRKSTLLAQHISFLKDFFRAYKDFSDAHIDTIEIMLSKLYGKWGITERTNFRRMRSEDYPILSDLYGLIEAEYKSYDMAAHQLYTEQILREVLLGLHSMCKGADAQFFNGHTNITSSRFLVFGVKGLLGAAKNVRNAMLFNILSFLSDKLLTEGNTVAALDELYIWLSNPTAIEYIRNCLKRVRKKESAMLLASQNLEDFDQEHVREMTKPLFSIPPHQFLFNAGSIDKRSYNGKWGKDTLGKAKVEQLKRWLSDYKMIFTTNYDCVLDDVLQTDEIKHLHGGFFYKKQDRQKRSDTLLGPDDACLIWGISGEEKEEEMKLGGGFTFPIQFPLESPMTIFQIYLSQLQNANAGRIDIFGYSGENDQHINRAIAQNPSIREIHYYCAPAKVSDPVEEFEVASRFSIKAPQKLMLESWNTIWNIFEQN